MQSSVALYETLEDETGLATDWKAVGSLRVASSTDRWLDIKRTATTAKSFGFELHLLSADEARDLFPLMSTEGVVGAAYVPSDGYIDPSSLTQSLARGARDGGVAIHEGVRVTGFEIERNRVRGVIVDGYVDAKHAGHDDYHIEVFGEAIAATRHDEALYDAKREKILA